MDIKILTYRFQPPETVPRIQYRLHLQEGLSMRQTLGEVIVPTPNIITIVIVVVVVIWVMRKSRSCCSLTRPRPPPSNAHGWFSPPHPQLLHPREKVALVVVRSIQEKPPASPNRWILCPEILSPSLMKFLPPFRDPPRSSQASPRLTSFQTLKPVFLRKAKLFVCPFPWATAGR